MLEEIKLKDFPEGNYLQAENEIYEILIMHHCTIGAFKLIVDNITDRIVHSNPISK